MARIAGIDLPRDKRIEIALTYIYGIGRKTATDICKATGVNPGRRRIEAERIYRPQLPRGRRPSPRRCVRHQETD